jgi:hypothetical protein
MHTGLNGTHDPIHVKTIDTSFHGRSNRVPF